MMNGMPPLGGVPLGQPQPPVPPALAASLVGRMVGRPTDLDDGPGVVTADNGDRLELSMVVAVGHTAEATTYGWRWPVLVLAHDGTLNVWHTGKDKLRVVQVRP